jgi:DNA-binding XRE family transcriptional regulator
MSNALLIVDEAGWFDGREPLAKRKHRANDPAIMSLAIEEMSFRQEPGCLRIRADFRAKLLELRVDLGMSQGAAAEVAGVSRGTYFRWERGESPALRSRENLERLATFYNVRLRWLLRGEEPREPDNGGVPRND